MTPRREEEDPRPLIGPDDIDPYFVTIYLASYATADVFARATALEEHLGVEVALGFGDWINVYTKKADVVNKAVAFIGDTNVVEVVP